MNTNSNRADLYLLILPLMLLALLRLAGFDGMVGQDGYAYVDYARNIRQWLQGGVHPGDFFWPPGYPLLGAMISFLGFSVPFSMQLVSCLSLSGTLIFTGRLIKCYYPQHENKSLYTYLFLFGLFAPYFFRNGMVTTSDMTACLMVSLVLYYAYQYVQHFKLSHLVVVAIAVSIGALVRYPVAVILAPLVIYLAWIWLRKVKNQWHLLVVLIPLAVISFYLLFKPDYTSFLGHKALGSWSVSNYFTGTFNTDDGRTTHILPNLIFIFSPFYHPGWIWPGLVFSWFVFKSKEGLSGLFLFGLLPYLTYALFLAGNPDQNPRHLLIGFPMVLFCCYPGYDQLYNKYKTWRFLKPAMVLLLTIQVFLAARAFQASFKRNALERQLVARLIDLKDLTRVPVLYSFDMDIALASRGIPFEVRNLFKEEYIDFERGALVLFNEKGLNGQWKGKNPMINWEKLKHNYQLNRLESSVDGWELYEIE